MRVLLLLSLSLALPLAAAGSTPYDIPPGRSDTFLVPGDGATAPTVNQQQGSVRVVSASYLAGYWFVTLECSTWSSSNCVGTIDA